MPDSNSLSRKPVCSEYSLSAGLFLPLLIFVCVLFLLFGVDVFSVATTAILLIAIFLCFKDINRNIFFVLFLCSFYTFLISGDVAQVFFNKTYYQYLNMPEEAIRHSHIATLISIFFLFVGYFVTKTNNLSSQSSEECSSKMASYRKITLLIFYVSYAVLLFDTINILLFVLSNGYVAYYSSYKSVLPDIVVSIGDFCPMAFCGFLATFPRKRKAVLPIILYLFFAIVCLLMGQRGGIVYITSFIFSLCLYRNKYYSYGQKWVKKRLVLFLLILVPFALVAFQLITFIRNGSEIVFNSFGETLGDFFINIGSSSKVIKNGYLYRDSISSFKFYSFGDVINYFKYSRLFTWLTGINPPSIHSETFALEGHSFDAFISYMYMRTQFLNGEGSGSSFVAELYADFGFFGVAAGSLFYGFLLKKISHFDRNNWIMTTIKLYMLLYIFKTPRGNYSAPFGMVINVSFALFVLVCCSVANWRKGCSKSAEVFQKSMICHQENVVR